MKTKILSALFAVVIIFFLTACGSSDKPVINDNNTQSSSSSKQDEDKETEKSTDPEASEPTEKTEDEDNNEVNYSDKIYRVGEDIPAGGYAIHCTAAEYSSMQVVIFADEENYKNFNDAKKVTVGQYNEAVELNAWADFYIEPDESAFIGLREGNVILLDGGFCEFNTYDPASSDTLYTGVYVVGEDIGADKINVTCTSEYLQLVLFADSDKYLSYHKSGRFTGGEEDDAIEQNAEYTEYAYGSSDSIFAELKDGMIMMVKYGTGKYSADEGPVIN